MKFLGHDHHVPPMKFLGHDHHPLPCLIKMLIFLIQLLWNRIWSSRGVKVTNVPQVFFCLPLHFYQGIQTDEWWVIPGDPKPAPFLYLTDLAFLILKSLSVLYSPCLGLVLLSKAFPPHAVFRIHLTLCVASPSPQCGGDEFMDSVPSRDERPLNGTYRFYIDCARPFSPSCSCLFHMGSHFKHCFVLIDLSFLNICCQINLPVSFFCFGILPVFCSWSTYMNCTCVFLRNCAGGRCYLARQNWFSLSQGSEVYLMLHLWYKLQHWQAKEHHVILQWAEGVTF